MACQNWKSSNIKQKSAGQLSSVPRGRAITVYTCVILYQIQSQITCVYINVAHSSHRNRGTLAKTLPRLWTAIFVYAPRPKRFGSFFGFPFGETRKPTSWTCGRAGKPTRPRLPSPSLCFIGKRFASSCYMAMVVGSLFFAP